MNRLKQAVVFFVAVTFLASIPQGAFGDEVDAIYENIKQAGPKYAYEEQILTFQNQGLTLVCTLTVPKLKRSYPTVLVLHGFKGDRKGFPIGGTDEMFFDPLARILAGQGFCVFRVDFRGSGESDGTFDLTTFTGQLDDAVAALDFIETLPDPVDSETIGLVGHSQGGLVSSLLASSDERIKSTVLWAAVAAPALTYQDILLKDGVRRGLALPDGGTDNFQLFVNGEYINLDAMLSKQFFVEMFIIDPVAAIKNYDRPLMYISPMQDAIVWPQPMVGQSYLEHHEGKEKLVTVDAGHNYNFATGPEVVEDICYWTAAWFIKTLKK